MGNDAAACRDCGRPLAAGETRVLGAAYCDACVNTRTLFCHTCRSSLKAEDFAQGRAVTLLGRRYCERCLACAVSQGRAEAGSASSRKSRPVATAPDGQVDTVTIRRLYGRYMPHHDAVLVARTPGLGGLLRGNRVRLWLDVAEGGFRAILGGSFGLDVPLTGSIDFAPTGESFPFRATVRHVRPSPSHLGGVLVGCRFERPSLELQSFIMGKMSVRPAMLPPATRKPTSTSVPPPSRARA